MVSRPVYWELEMRRQLITKHFLRVAVAVGGPGRQAGSQAGRQPGRKAGRKAGRQAAGSAAAGTRQSVVR